MGHLSVTSETGMFHSACLFEFDRPPRLEWRGFQPAVARTPVSGGRIDRSNREANINHYIRFTVKDSILDLALAGIERTYSTLGYRLGVTDCVSFTSEIARLCGLIVPQVNMTPYGLVQTLRANSYTHLDVVPYPW
jgi:hypothetical protein